MRFLRSHMGNYPLTMFGPCSLMVTNSSFCEKGYIFFLPQALFETISSPNILSSQNTIEK